MAKKLPQVQLRMMEESDSLKLCSGIFSDGQFYAKKQKRINHQGRDVKGTL